MADKTLPQIYRESADLVLKVGKVEGDMKSVEVDGESIENPRCFGFCTMGAVFDAAGGILDEFGQFVMDEDFIQTPEFRRLAEPVARQIVDSDMYPDYLSDGPQNSVFFWTIANWNDSAGAKFREPEPSAEDVAKLLRETADAVEKAEASK